jgi:hypothetical protein
MTQQNVAFSFFRETVFSTMIDREIGELEGQYRTSNPRTGSGQERDNRVDVKQRSQEQVVRV